jgi:hypothetical protein
MPARGCALHTCEEARWSLKKNPRRADRRLLDGLTVTIADISAKPGDADRRRPPHCLESSTYGRYLTRTRSACLLSATNLWPHRHCQAPCGGNNVRQINNIDTLARALQCADCILECGYRSRLSAASIAALGSNERANPSKGGGAKLPVRWTTRSRTAGLPGSHPTRDLVTRSGSVTALVSILAWTCGFAGRPPFGSMLIF